MIVLVRDPVDRAYSEYQMKIRRVETQEEFLSDVQYDAWPLLQCLIKHPYVKEGKGGEGGSRALPNSRVLPRTMTSTTKARRP